MTKEYIVNSIQEGNNVRDIFPTFHEAVSFSVSLKGFVNIVEVEAGSVVATTTTTETVPVKTTKSRKKTTT